VCGGGGEGGLEWCQAGVSSRRGVSGHWEEGVQGMQEGGGCSVGEGTGEGGWEGAGGGSLHGGEWQRTSLPWWHPLRAVHRVGHASAGCPTSGLSVDVRISLFPCLLLRSR
jgi:hypothetical protein